MNLLLTGAFPFSEQHIAELSELFSNVFFIQDERIPLDKQDLEFDVSEIDAVVCNALFLQNDFNRFSLLRFIHLTSAGFERVALAKMRASGIRVENARGIYSIPMAEWALLKILEIYKHSHSFNKSQKNGLWEKNRNVIELSGKTVTVFGLGAVGSEIAKRLKAFDCCVIGINPSVRSNPFIDDYRGLNNVEDTLSEADVVVLALPLTSETHHFINDSRLSAMKDNAVLVNISRGEVIDESALIDALRAGKFMGVALDVFEQEPLPQSSPLWAMDRVLITPHNSFVSDNVNARLYSLMRKNLQDFVAKS